MYLNKPFSQVRQDVKNGNIGSGKVRSQPGKSFFHSVTGKVGLGTTGVGLAGAAIHSIADTKPGEISGEMGNHFHNAFAGINEDSGGFSVASSSGPMPAVGGASILLKDKSPLDFKDKLKKLNIRRTSSYNTKAHYD